MLYRIKELTIFLTHNNVLKQFKDNSNIKSVINLLKLMKESNQQSLKAGEIDALVGNTCMLVPDYQIGQQEDAQEFLTGVTRQLRLDCSNIQNNAFTNYNLDVTKLCNGNKEILKFPENDPRTFISQRVKEYYCDTERVEDNINNVCKYKDELDDLFLICENNNYTTNIQQNDIYSLPINNNDNRFIEDIIWSIQYQNGPTMSYIHLIVL